MTTASSNFSTDDQQLNFPVPVEPLKEHQHDITWAQWMDEMEGRLLHYSHHHDRPEARLESKIHDWFRL